MIEVDKLTKYFGPVLAVDRVSFKIDKGEIIGLLGLNGAGKTTTMRILTTFLPATTGSASGPGKSNPPGNNDKATQPGSPK